MMQNCAVSWLSPSHTHKKKSIFCRQTCIEFPLFLFRLDDSRSVLLLFASQIVHFTVLLLLLLLLPEPHPPPRFSTHVPSLLGWDQSSLLLLGDSEEVQSGLASSHETTKGEDGGGGKQKYCCATTVDSAYSGHHRINSSTPYRGQFSVVVCLCSGENLLHRRSLL